MPSAVKARIWITRCAILVLTCALIYVATPVSSQTIPTEAATSPSPEASERAREPASPDQIREKAINDDLIITFSEFPRGTFISDQYAHLGIVFAGDNPFIAGDLSNPTSPVLSGSPLFRGAIEGRFVNPDDKTTPIIVSGFSLDAGYFDALGSVRLRWFDIEGRLLGQRASSRIGIENFEIEGGSIHSWRIEIIETEPAGFAVDNVSFLPEVGTSLLFRENRDGKKEGTWGLGADQIPGFDHVALHVNDRVYESHPGYDTGTYVSVDGRESIRIFERNGAQAQHSRKTFEHDAMEAGRRNTPVIDFEEIAIPRNVGLSMRSGIRQQIQAGARFQKISISFPEGIERTLLPRVQKGGGGTFTCVGLVEWAAENAGYKEGQGFIPDALESFTYPYFTFNPPRVEFREAPLLSPQLLNYAAKFDRLVLDGRQWFQGFFDPVDFLVTDPLGRRLGFTPALGELNEIPGAFFSGDGNIEQFLIANPVPGEYRVELFGRGERVAGAVNVGGQNEGIDEFLASGEPMEMEFEVGSVPGSRGDLDGDGDVDRDDLDLLRERLNSFVNDTNDPADINADGLIEQRDADLLVELCTRRNCARGRGVTCSAGPKSHCLQRSRFKVEVEWRDFDGNRGVGDVIPISSDDSGLFWFFNPDNWEILVKVLNGCAINDRFWVFSAATTNVEYTLRVTDTATGRVREYFNPLGAAAVAVTDTDAFRTCNVRSFQGSTPPRTDVSNWFTQAALVEADKGGACPSGLSRLCLNQSRFEATIDWRDFNGNRGSGKVVTLRSEDSGLFWFFDEDNWEVLVKILNGCAVNDRYWVFSAATTNVGYTLRVRDTKTGQVKEYVNRLGESAHATTDTSAFATCP